MHRGAEKLFEVRDYRQIIVLANRHDWLSAFSNELGLAMAVGTSWIKELSVDNGAKRAAMSLTAGFGVGAGRGAGCGSRWHGDEGTKLLPGGRERAFGLRHGRFGRRDGAVGLVLVGLGTLGLLFFGVSNLVLRPRLSADGAGVEHERQIVE